MSILHITKENFETEVLNSKGTVLVDFWAEWCMPCRMMMPVVDKIAEENPSVKVGKINIDEQEELASRYKVMTIPTLMVFKDGKPVESSIGVQTKTFVEKMLK
ncbi:thioredoxin [Clostridium sp. AM58-1XD]|uniref:thioredoxin n=1 Tax=Clostridium sp. AM58-1XD TaxID=2292307 RepID=UPI000E5201B6|nr:thioredoxin [Clostridium sp. AM58-1XD]RGZ00147.1 thioredoxin [Clostridium sp. AM58-1XD]